MAYIPGQYSDAVALQEHTERKLRNKYDRVMNNSLKEIGKSSAFKEYFEGIKLENQELPKMESVDNLIENTAFLEGRKFGFLLIQKGFNEEMYHDYKQTPKHR